ncbi:Gamma-aminobutyraldehyde dehydrogenase [compost metagenome]
MRDQLYINGEWVSPDLGGYLDVIDPATEQVFHRVAAGTEEDVDHAVRAARRAFDNGWGQTRGAERAQWLEVLADELESGQQALDSRGLVGARIEPGIGGQAAQVAARGRVGNDPDNRGG